MAEASANTSIWDFVLNYYGRKGVSEALIGLQDSYGIDVNMLLFLVWVAAQRRSLGADDVQRVSEASHAWQRNVVVPIRAVRRLLKENAPLVSPDTAAAFRKKVQAVELEGEQAQLNAMAAMSATLTPRRASSSADGPSFPSTSAHISSNAASMKCSAACLAGMPEYTKPIRSLSVWSRNTMRISVLPLR